MRELELEVLAAVDKVSGGSVSSAGSTSRVGVDARARDPAMAARVGMSRLRRELQELEGIAEDQERPSDRAAALDALAERVESHDSIRQIFRDALLRASRADERDEADERAELLGDAVDAPDGAAVPPPRDEAGALALASEATESLRRSRARMAEELDKGRRTLAAMAQSRAAMKKTGDEYAGNQRAALRGGGKLLARLERQAVTERLVLWGGFACFLLACAHVALKRTPVLVRFHPLWWIRHAAVRKAKEAEATREAAARALENDGGGAAAATVMAAAAGAAAVAALGADAAPPRRASRSDGGGKSPTPSRRRGDVPDVGRESTCVPTRATTGVTNGRRETRFGFARAGVGFAAIRRRRLVGTGRRTRAAFSPSFARSSRALSFSPLFLLFLL